MWRTVRRVLKSGLITAALLLPEVIAPGAASALPDGFGDQIIFNTGLTDPVNFSFTREGRVFIGERAGVVKTFDSITDTTPTVVADLSSNVFTGWDRGMLGLAVDNQFASGRPYVYVAYALDAAIGGTPPLWKDECTTWATVGCVVGNRVSRLTLDAQMKMTDEQVLVEDWCHQFGGHSIGDIKMLGDGSLLVSAGDGANFDGADVGQFGSPPNPCNDTTNEGGAFRALDYETPGDPQGLAGSVIRIHADTGAPWATNASAASADVNRARVVAYGLRNPFRMTVRPGTNELWVGDVGWGIAEEINRVTNLGVANNFGWPCYEGPDPQPQYERLGHPVCTSLYNGQATAPTQPWYSYGRQTTLFPGDPCETYGQAVSALAFYPGGGSLPTAYNGALFLGDYARRCIWAVMPGQDGLPDLGKMVPMFSGEGIYPVDFEIGPGGDMYWLDIAPGRLHRLVNGPVTGPPPPPPQTGEVPAVRIAAPLADTTYAPGETLVAAAEVIDLEDGSLSGDAVTWSLALQHCSFAGGTCHEHLVATAKGTSTTFVVPAHEEPYHIDLRVAATDSGGQTTTVSQRLNLRSDSVASQPKVGGIVAFITPNRLLDTRPGSVTADGLNSGSGLMPGGSVLSVPIIGRVGIIPGTSSVALNLTATSNDAAGYVTVFACGQPVPNASTLSLDRPGRTVANEATVAIGAGGSICVYSSVGTHVIVDVVGVHPADASFVAMITPVRLTDTRSAGRTDDGVGTATGRLVAGETRAIAVGGRVGIPADAEAAILNVTAVDVLGAGYLTVFPCGSSVPNASNLNPEFVGQTLATSATVPLGARGEVCVYSSVATDLIVDVDGHYREGSSYQSLAQPFRGVDTRPGSITADSLHAGGGPVAAGSILEIQVGGRAGIPLGATGIVMSLTATNTAGSGYVTAFACATRLPNTSNLNLDYEGQTISNSATVRLHPNGRLCLFSSQTTHLIVDFAGFHG